MDRKATGLPLVEGTRHILEAMKRHGVRRYIGHGTPSVLDPQEKPTFQTRLVGFMGRTMLPRAYQELTGMTVRAGRACPTRGQPTCARPLGGMVADNAGRPLGPAW